MPNRIISLVTNRLVLLAAVAMIAKTQAPLDRVTTGIGVQVRRATSAFEQIARALE